MLTTDFWKKYIKVWENGELTSKMLKELPLTRDKDGFYTYFNDTLFCSYLDDLLQYISENHISVK